MNATGHFRLRFQRSITGLAVFTQFLLLCPGSAGSTTWPGSVRDERGERVDLARAVGESKATVFIFVRSDCPISNRYAPELLRLRGEYSPRGVRFFLVYVDPSQDAGSVREHRSKYFPSFEALLDPKHELTAMTGAETTPEAVVFNLSQEMVYRGRIDDRYIDFGKARPRPTRRDLAVALDETVSGHPVTVPRTRAVGCYIQDLR